MRVLFVKYVTIHKFYKLIVCFFLICLFLLPKLHVRAKKTPKV